MPAIPALGRLKQEDYCKVEASLGYTVSSWILETVCLKITQKGLEYSYSSLHNRWSHLGNVSEAATCAGLKAQASIVSKARGPNNKDPHRSFYTLGSFRH